MYSMDETVLRVKKPCVDVDSRELLALETSYGRSSLNTLSPCKEKNLK
jgi:hypothetical protein